MVIMPASLHHATMTRLRIALTLLALWPALAVFGQESGGFFLRQSVLLQLHPPDRGGDPLVAQASGLLLVLPAYQKRRDRPWLRKAKALERRLRPGASGEAATSPPGHPPAADPTPPAASR